MNAVTSERVALYYREGSSDKVYQAAIEPAGSQFVVNFAYGRRGSTLTTGTKTSSPVDYSSAKKIYEKLVGEKKAKGYTEGENGTPYQHADKQPSGLLPQLPNSIEESEVKQFLCDDNYCAQEKFDGRHLLTRKTGGTLEGVNKRGFFTGLPQSVADELRRYPGTFIADGEAVGDDYIVFDLLELDGEDLRPLPYWQRYSLLVGFTTASKCGFKRVRFAWAATSAVEKAELWQRLKRENREGIVFKRNDAPFTPGKPNSGVPQLKFKFVATASAIVTKVNVQRSVEVGLMKGRSLVSCSNVTIPANQPIPKVGDVVEVRYLYAYRDSLALYQPVYLGLRDDVDPSDCTVQQLKFKAE